ncbi:hypothetical protein XaC1_399 [Xanthomonas phage XaC1]|nr:hypothetical protein XaC1_399 [Xanthomonas phage XaC1]
MDNIEISYATIATKTVSLEKFLRDRAILYTYDDTRDYHVQYYKVPKGSRFVLITYDLVLDMNNETIEVASLVIDTDELLYGETLIQYILDNKERLIDLREPE